MTRRVGVDEWRTVQVFLSPKGTGIYEVEMTMDATEIRCNCPTYKSRMRCRHVKFVESKIDESGAYPIFVHPSARDEDLADHVTDRDRFRKFVLKYAKIEVV
jgi:hypothetical protein